MLLYEECEASVLPAGGRAGNPGILVIVADESRFLSEREHGQDKVRLRCEVEARLPAEENVPCVYGGERCRAREQKHGAILLPADRVCLRRSWGHPSARVGNRPHAGTVGGQRVSCAVVGGQHVGCAVPAERRNLQDRRTFESVDQRPAVRLSHGPEYCIFHRAFFRTGRPCTSVRRLF